MSLNELFDLSGKVAIVTGGGNGIGKACCEQLAEAGASVIVSDLKIQDAEAVAGEIGKKNGFAKAIDMDVTRDIDLTRLVDFALSSFDAIHILVNNAGGGGGGRENPFQLSVTEFEWRFRINVYSGWRLSQLCVPYMKKEGYGSIVNISSMSSVNRSPSMSAYAASKAAVNHMTANLAFDFGPDVRINAVAPGAIRTRALQSVLTPDIEKTMLSHTPLKRLGEVEDIARAVLYFASPASSWVTGQVLFVNGGGVQTLD